MDIEPVKVLFIEDNPGDVKLLRAMLSKAGGPRFDLIVADGLATGLSSLSREHIGLVLLDLNLPDSQGLETFTRVYGRFPKLPMIVITGIADEALAIKSVQEGAQDYLVKGKFDGYLLVRSMTYAIERKLIEQERLAHLRFFENMDQINRAMQVATDLEQMMSNVLDAVLSIFDCDRAWLVYPCDPKAPRWRVPMERTRPEYPGAFALGLEVPMDADAISVFRTVLATIGPVTFGPGAEHPQPAEMTKRFGNESQIAMAIYPKGDKPYVFGLHQCSYPRVWTPEEKQLLQEIGRRLTDALTSLLMYRNLRESEQKYRLLVNQIPAVVFKGYADWSVDFFDQKVEILAGYSKEDFNSRKVKWSDLILPEDFPEAKGKFVEALKGDKSYQREYRIRRKTGDIRWVQHLGQIFCDGDGKVDYVSGVFFDITERKQAEEELCLKEKLLDGASDSIFLLDLDGHFLYLNEAAYKDRGYEKEELLGKDLSVLDTPEFAKLIGSRLNDLMAKGKSIFESAHRRKDGSVMPVEIHARTINLADRQLILSVARDITKRQIAENEIKLNEARLASLVKIGQYESESIQDLLDFTLDEAIALTSSKIGYIYFYDDETRQFTLTTWSQEVMQECTIAESQTIYQLEKTGIWGEAVRQARPIMVNDFQAPHPLKKGYPEGHAQIDKFLTIPVFSGERIVAVVAVANKETDYDEADIRQLTLMMDAVWKIATKRQVEEELRQRGQEYRSLMNNIPGFVFKGYADYTVDFFDDKIETFTGYSKEEFNSKRLKWSELVIQEDLQNAKAIFVQALKLDRQYVREYRLKKKEGEIVWIQERSQIVKDPGGDIDSISGIFFDITERKRVEEALRESQEKLNAILETTPAGIFLVNGEGCITFANRMMADLFAYRNDEILGTAYVDLVHPDERSLGFMKMKSLMAGEIDFVSLERRYLAADGRGFWGHLSGRQLLDANGGFVGLVGVITDITARKLAEEELRLKGKLLDGASDSIFLHDQTGHILYVNEAAYKDRGYTKEELLALDISALVTPEFAGLRASLLQDLFTQGEITFESAHLRKDGSALPVEIHARTIDLDHEKLILSAARDIGERKEAEEELRLAAQKWRTTFDAIGDAVCLIDRDLKIIQCNQAMVNLAGKPSAEIMGLTCGEILLGTSQPPEVCASILMSKSGHRETMTLPRGDRWLHAVADPILNEAGEFTGGVYIIADITDFQRATQQIKDLNTLLRAIKEINEALLRVKSEKELFQQTCDLLLGVPYVRFTWIGLVDPDSLEVKPAAWAGAEDGYLSVVKVAWDDSPYGMGPTGEAFRTGRPFVRSNIETDPQPNPWREEALQRGFKSSIALPFIHQTEVIGILKVYSGKTDAFGSEETEFFNQVAGDISVGVKSLRLEQELVQGVIKLQIMIHQTVETMATIVETRDPYTAGHQQGVAHLAGAIAAKMGLDADRLQGLRVAGLLHDIGKIVVPAEILSKPGRLNEMEFLLIKAHSQVGADILGRINFPWPVAQIVLQHHERINGSGYPQGLTAQDILLEARILAVADVVEAMSSHRPYRAALGIDQALDEITKNKGALYDAEVVDTCVKLLTEKEFRFQT